MPLSVEVLNQISNHAFLMAASANEVLSIDKKEKYSSTGMTGAIEQYVSELKQTLFRAQIILEILAKAQPELKKLVEVPLKHVSKVTKGSYYYGA